MSLQMIGVVVVLVGICALIWAWISTGAGFFGRHKEKKANRAMLTILEGYRAIASGNYGEAIEYLRQSIAEGTKDPLIYVMLCVLYRRAGQAEKAITMGEGILLRSHIDQGVASVIVDELIKTYRISGNMHRAEDCLKNLASSKINTKGILLLEADLLAATGNYEEASKKYQKYEKLTGLPTAKEIAAVYVKMSDSQKGSPRIKLLLTAQKYHPLSFNLNMALARAYFEENRPGDGRDLLTKIASLGLPMSKEQLEELQDLFYLHSSIANLYDLMTKQVAAESENPSASLYLAMYHSKKGESGKASDILRDYLLKQEPKAIITKEYVRLSGETALRQAVQSAELYVCNECKARWEEYTTVCSRCGSSDSLRFL